MRRFWGGCIAIVAVLLFSSVHIVSCDDSSVAVEGGEEVHHTPVVALVKDASDHQDQGTVATETQGEIDRRWSARIAELEQTVTDNKRSLELCHAEKKEVLDRDQTLRQEIQNFSAKVDSHARLLMEQEHEMDTLKERLRQTEARLVNEVEKARREAHDAAARRYRHMQALHEKTKTENRDLVVSLRSVEQKLEHSNKLLFETRRELFQAHELVWKMEKNDPIHFIQELWKTIQSTLSQWLDEVNKNEYVQDLIRKLEPILSKLESYKAPLMDFGRFVWDELVGTVRALWVVVLNHPTTLSLATQWNETVIQNIPPIVIQTQNNLEVKFCQWTKTAANLLHLEGAPSMVVDCANRIAADCYTSLTYLEAGIVSFSVIWMTRWVCRPSLKSIKK